MPFLVTAGIGTAALELGDVGFPFRLTREGGEFCHVLLEVKVVLDIHNHEEAAAFAVDLHIQDANFALALDDFRPYVGVGLHVFLYHLLVVHEREGLAISLHVSFKFNFVDFASARDSEQAPSPLA